MHTKTRVQITLHPRGFCAVFGVSRRSDLHADVPCTPDDGAQVADGNAVTDAVHVTALVANRSRHEADAVDDVVASDLEGLAVLTLDGDAAVVDLGDGGVQVGRDLCLLYTSRCV